MLGGWRFTGVLQAHAGALPDSPGELYIESRARRQTAGVSDMEDWILMSRSEHFSHFRAFQ